MRALENVEFHNAMPAHDHNDKLIKNASSFEFELNNVQFEVRGSDYVKTQYQNCVHHGVKSSKEGKNIAVNQYVKESGIYDVYPAVETMNLTCNIKDIECTEYGEDKESYPDYTCI